MLSRLSLAQKVLGLVGLLLVLTIALAWFLLWQVSRLQQEMQVMVQREVPLASSLMDLHEYALRRHLAFESWLRALESSPPNQKAIKEAQADYAEFTERLNKEFVTAKKLLDLQVSKDRHRREIADFRGILAQIEAAYPTITALQRQVLELQIAGQYDRANEVLTGLEKLGRSVRDQRGKLQDDTAALAQDAAENAAAHQRLAFWVTLAVSISAVLLGLTISVIIAAALAEEYTSDRHL